MNSSLASVSQSKLKQALQLGLQQGCPKDQLLNIAQAGIRLRAANMDRVSGWSAILHRLGDPTAGIKPTLYIHKRCKHLLECLPYVQHDPDRPGDILKSNINEDGVGGDDAADALRYLIATKPREIRMVKLRGG
jgi:hypothetical protein